MIRRIIHGQPGKTTRSTLGSASRNFAAAMAFLKCRSIRKCNVFSPRLHRKQSKGDGTPPSAEPRQEKGPFKLQFGQTTRTNKLFHWFWSLTTGACLSCLVGWMQVQVFSLINVLKHLVSSCLNKVYQAYKAYETLWNVYKTSKFVCSFYSPFCRNFSLSYRSSRFIEASPITTSLWPIKLKCMNKNAH